MLLQRTQALTSVTKSVGVHYLSSRSCWISSTLIYQAQQCLALSIWVYRQSSGNLPLRNINELATIFTSLQHLDNKSLYPAKCCQPQSQILSIGLSKFIMLTISKTSTSQLYNMWDHNVRIPSEPARAEPLPGQNKWEQYWACSQTITDTRTVCWEAPWSAHFV
jgi:hypothetical protein